MITISFASIAETLHQGELEGDVIVLAQASMTGAEALCGAMPVPILGGTRLGLVAALRAYRATTSAVNSVG